MSSRRDGSPFLNLLMVAPLFDNRGRVRYFIGAQVDVTGLVEDGKGIDSFERLLAEDRAKSEKAEGPTQESNGSDEPEKPLQALGQLGKMLSWEESMEVQSHTRRNSRDSFSPASSANMYGKKEVNTRSGGRRVLGDENVPEMVEKAAWGLSVSGLSGKLPGVYQYYMLVRSHPSLRIIFVSPSLRIPGLLQSNFLSRIGGPTSIRDGIEDAFAQGVPVTAKVSWLPIGKPVDDDSDNRSPDNRAYGNNVNGNSAGNRGTGNGSGTGRHAPSASSQPQQARTRWLSCTPLCGSDDRVGVWMVVMVEDTNPTRVIGVRPSFANSNADNTTNGIERLDSGRRSAMASPKHPVTNGRLAQENQVPKYTENPRSLDSPVASDDFSVRPASQSSDSSTIVPRSLPRGLTQIPPRGASKKIWPHSYSPALSPSLTPTLSPDAVQSWVPASNGPPARNSSTVDSHSNGGAHGAGGTTATTDLADQEASQTQKAFADFAAKMTAPRREGMVVSDRGVDLRNGRVMGREHGAGRVGDQGVGVAN
ncbi:hypothetical protein MMC13_004608 [Lambiella insularis]|nr:hypothetical protein [Lambiella insularis]